MQCFPASVLTESVELATTCRLIIIMQQVIIASGQQWSAVSHCHSNKLADRYTQGIQTEDCALFPMHACKYTACHTPKLNANEPE